MLDGRYIRENLDLIKQVCKDKNSKVDLDGFVAMYEEVKALQQQDQDLNTQKNAAAKEQNAELGKQIKEKMQQLAEILPAKQKALNELLWQIPNTYSADTPVGKDDSENKVLRTWGEIPTFSFPVKDHVDLGVAADILDFESAGKISGSRFVFLKNNLVKMQFALIQWVMDKLTDQKVIDEIIKKNNLKVKNTPFSLVLPPFFMKMEVMDKMGRLNPKDERYCYEEDGIVLNGSAEHVLGPLQMDNVLTEEQMPIRYLGYSTAFRREAGSYGRDTKGMIRMHQFDKLEMESFCLPEDGQEEQNFMIAIQEYMMQELEIPYHVLICCTGDMGDCDYRHIDIEAWIPSQEKYRETHSGDYMTDYQARRMNIRYKKVDGEKGFVHMNDATAFALSRTLVAIIENNQQADGTIKVPKILQKRVGSETLFNLINNYMKSVIIGGVPRAGKSTLAKMLNKKFGFSHIPTDPLVSAFQEYYPQLNIIHQDDILKTGEEFMPFMNRVSKTLKRMGGEFAIEGTHFHPGLFSDEVKELYTIIFLGYPSLTTEEKLTHTRNHDRENDGRTNRLEDEPLSRSLKSWIKTSKEIEQICKEQGFIFVDTSADYEGALEEVFKTISEIG